MAELGFELPVELGVVASSEELIAGFGQAQASIKTIYFRFSQAQADIKTVYQGYGQAQCFVIYRFRVHAQAQARIVAIVSKFAQARPRIKVVGNTSFGQAQANVAYRRYGSAQAQAQIIQVQKFSAQATALIDSPIKVQFGQAAAAIDGPIKQRWSQALAVIDYVLYADDFNRVVATGVGTNGTTTYTTVLIFPAVPSNLSVNGSEVVVAASAFAEFKGYPHAEYGVTKFDFWIPSQPITDTGVYQYRGRNRGTPSATRPYVFNIQPQGDGTWDIDTYNIFIEADGPLTTFTPLASTWYTIKYEVLPNNIEYVKVWKRDDPEPAVWDGSRTISAVAYGSNFTVEWILIQGPTTVGQVSKIDNLYIAYRGGWGWGQAQVLIGITWGLGQAQAQLVGSPFRFAQAQAFIGKSAGYAQAQASIKAPSYGFGQAQTYTGNFKFAQAAVDIRSWYKTEILRKAPNVISYWRMDTKNPVDIVGSNNGTDYDSSGNPVATFPSSFKSQLTNDTNAALGYPSSAYTLVKTGTAIVGNLPSFSVIFWSDFAHANYLYSETSPTLNDFFLIVWFSGFILAQIRGDTGSEVSFSTPKQVDDNFVAFTVSPTGVQFFVNGFLRNSFGPRTNDTNFTNTDILSKIGGPNLSGWFVPEVFMDEVTTFDRVLSNLEVQDLWTQGRIGSNNGVARVRFGQARVYVVSFGINKWAQAQVRVRQVYQQFSQAQANVVKFAKQSGFAQAQTIIERITVNSGQAQTYIRPRVGHGQAQVYIVRGAAAGQGFGPSEYPVVFNGLELPGYVQSESLSTEEGLADHYPFGWDGSITQQTGLLNPTISMDFLIIAPTYRQAKNLYHYAETIVRSAQDWAPLYIDYSDRHRNAKVKSISYHQIAEKNKTLLYTVEFETEFWVTSDTSHILTGSSGTITTLNRTLENGIWTPATVTLTGTNITVSGYTATEFTGYISVSGYVSNMVINSGNFTATNPTNPALVTLPGAPILTVLPGDTQASLYWSLANDGGEGNQGNANPQVVWKDYALFVGVGETNFAVTGADSITIEYSDRWWE